MLRLAAAMGAVPSEYFQYYYFEDEVLGELTAKPTTRAEDILGWVPGYWEHYEEQARQRRAASSTRPLARRHPRARAGDRLHGRRLQRPRRDAAGQRAQPGVGAGLPRLARGRDARPCATPTASGRCPMPGLPTHLRGLVEALAEYQQAAADAAWSGDARDAVRALAAHPLVRSLDLAERLYGEMAAAHRDAPARAARSGVATARWAARPGRRTLASLPPAGETCRGSPTRPAPASRPGSRTGAARPGRVQQAELRPASPARTGAARGSRP